MLSNYANSGAANGNATSTLTLAKPAGLAVGNLIVANIIYVASAPLALTPTALPGATTTWAGVATNWDAVALTSVVTAWKVADSADVAATGWDFVLSGGTIFGHAGFVDRVIDVDPANPINVSAALVTQTGTDGVLPGVTTTAPNTTQFSYGYYFDNGVTPTGSMWPLVAPTGGRFTGNIAGVASAGNYLQGATFRLGAAGVVAAKNVTLPRTNTTALPFHATTITVNNKPPVVLARQKHTSATTDNVAYTPTLATMTPGKSGLVIVAIDQNPSFVSATNDWIYLDGTENGTSVKGAVFWKARLTGTDALTITMTGAQQYSAASYCIDAGEFPQIAVAAANGSSTNSNPPNLAFGAVQNALIIATRCGDAAVVATVVPTGYLQHQSQAGGANGASVNTAEKVVIASSEDPAAWTSATEQWVSHTIAIWPTGGVQFSRSDKEFSISLDASNLVATGTTASVDANLARATIGHNSGKRVLRFGVTTIGSDDPGDSNAYFRPALTTALHNLVLSGGVATAVDWRNSTTNNPSGETRFQTNAGGFVYFTGMITQGDSSWMAVNFGLDKVWFKPNGSALWDGAYTDADVDAGTGGQSISTMTGKMLFPALGVDNFGAADVGVIDGDATGSGLSTFLTWNAVTAPGAGSAAGVATVAGVSQAGMQAAGSAAGVATVSGVGSYAGGPSTVDGVGTSTAGATAAGVGAALAKAAGAVAGIATAAAIGAAIATAAGSSAGVATANGAGAAAARAVGSSTAGATVNGVTSATAAAAGSSIGAATAAGVGSTLAKAAGSAPGVATVTGVGSSIATSAGTSTAGATVNGVGAAAVAGTGTSPGAGTATGVGAALAAGTGSAPGTSTALAISGSNAVSNGVGSAAGVATVAGVGSSLAKAAGSAPGVATAAGVGAARANATGSAAGVATANGAGQLAVTVQGAGTASAGATVTGVAAAQATGAGLTYAGATVNGAGATLAKASGSSAGLATAAGAGRVVSIGTGTCSASSTAAGVGAALAAGVGLAEGQAAVLGDPGALAQTTGTAAGAATVTGVGYTLVLDLHTPPERLYVVPAEVRRFHIAAESRTFIIAAETRRWSANNMNTVAIPNVIKDPQARLEYEIDWSDWLPEGDTVQEFSWSVPAGLTKSNEYTTGNIAGVWLTGGVLGARYTVTCHVKTVLTREDDRSISVAVRNR